MSVFVRRRAIGNERQQYGVGISVIYKCNDI